MKLTDLIKRVLEGKLPAHEYVRNLDGRQYAMGDVIEFHVKSDRSIHSISIKNRDVLVTHVNLAHPVLLNTGGDFTLSLSDIRVLIPIIEG